MDMPPNFPWDLLVPLGVKVIELGLRLWIEHLKNRRPPNHRGRSSNKPRKKREDR